MTLLNAPLLSDLTSRVRGSLILVISHRPTDAEAIGRQLVAAQFGCEIQAPPSEDPASLLRRHPPDLILLDMAARGREALGLLGTVRSQARGEPPILAAVDADDSRADVLAGGADDVIVKPLVLDELAARVRNLLLIRWLLREQQDHSAQGRRRDVRPLPDEADFTWAMARHVEQAVVACDDKGDLSFSNDAAMRLGLGALQLGHPATLALGRLRTPEGRDLTPDDDPLHRAWTGEKVTDHEVLVSTPDRGVRTYVANATPILAGTRRLGAVVTLHDITDLRRVQDELGQGLVRDRLTGLPNDVLFFELARRTIAANARDHHPLAMIVITVEDLDELSEHQAAGGPAPLDLTLAEFARRLAGLMRPADIAARHGQGFALLCTAPVEESDAQHIIARLRSGLSRPLDLGHRRVEARLTFGLAMTQDAHLAPEALVRIASAARRP